VGVIPPTSQEKKACNPVETYRLEEDGRTVTTTFTFNDGSPTGPQRRYHPKGIITDAVNKSTWKILVGAPCRCIVLSPSPES
jgi:apolipoprotein D and lipocalin family protein